MLVELLQAPLPTGLDQSEHWAYIGLGVLASVLGAILASPLIVRIYEHRKKKETAYKTDSQALELSKDQELYKIREELRQEVEALRQVKDQIATEKLNLTQQVFMLNIRIKEYEVHAIELDEEILLKASQIEMLKRRITTLEKEKQEWLWETRHDQGEESSIPPPEIEADPK